MTDEPQNTEHPTSRKHIDGSPSGQMSIEDQTSFQKFRSQIVAYFGVLRSWKPDGPSQHICVNVTVGI